MNDDNNKIELSIKDLFIKLLRSAKTIALITFICGVLTAGYSLTLKPVYQSTVLVTSSAKAQASNTAISALTSRFSGLASIAGVSLSGAAASLDAEMKIAYLRSTKFTMMFIEEQNLYPHLYPDDWDSEASTWIDPDDRPTVEEIFRNFDNSVRQITFNVQNNLLKVRINFNDPELAAKIANGTIQSLNNHMKSKTIEESERNIAYLEKELRETKQVDLRQVLYNMIAQQVESKMIANVTEESAFKVIDPALPPSKRISPRRTQMTIFGAIIGFFFSCLFVLVRDTALYSEMIIFIKGLRKEI